jgi:hypothetical protein
MAESTWGTTAFLQVKLSELVQSTDLTLRPQPHSLEEQSFGLLETLRLLSLWCARL